MAKQSLAVKYRPKTFEDVIEQDSIKTILLNQLKTNTFKNAYLFCGPSGDGKTTCARIFANEINKGQGNPIEMDAASNSGVDDVRNITQQAQTQSLNSEYKVFIIDECHSISNTGWQAFLKLIEEPPAKSIFIFCTTDPQKIPKTVKNRVQRYDFQRISQKGIVDRLAYILCQEYEKPDAWKDALEYIAKIADGGMRDAITMLDKCLSYSPELTLENVVQSIGGIEYQTMIELTNDILDGLTMEMVDLIEDLYESGKELKLFMRQYINFILDVNKKLLGTDKISIPLTSEISKWFDDINNDDWNRLIELLDVLIKLNADIKYSQYVKADIEATLMLFIERRDET